MHSITQVALTGKRVLLRTDLNVPLQQGYIRSDWRIRSALPTIQYALKQQAAVILLSHLGRPPEGYFTAAFSLLPVAACLEYYLGHPVRFVVDWLKGIMISAGEVVLCENVRMQRGESANDPHLAQAIARLGDIFVMDAFATAHRTEASTVGVAQYVPIACAGLLLSSELQYLTKALEKPNRPLVAIVGGAKVSTKWRMLASLLRRVDSLIVGGGIANTFLAAQGWSMGASLYEATLVSEVKQLLALAHEYAVRLLFPLDVITSTLFSSQASGTVKRIWDIEPEDRILDVGPRSNQHYRMVLQEAGTILWNGPIGLFEWEAFAYGTKNLALTIADSTALSLVGGGDTLVAVAQYGIADKLSYLSTGGGAFVSFLSGEPLPAVQILETHSS